MRFAVVTGILGRLLQILSGLLLVPVPLALVYGGGSSGSAVFLGTALLSLAAGTLLQRAGKIDEPSLSESVYITVLSWILVSSLAAIPLSTGLSPGKALFEAVSGLTTTGISAAADPALFSPAVLFWRSLIQWIGGLGILTFFVAVVRESGAVSRKLFSAEAHKTDPGSIRPSLLNSVKSLWKVYGFLTSVLIGAYVVAGMGVFDAVLHSLTTLSTGGFSTGSMSLGAYGAPVQAVSAFFMLLGGINFVILYRLLRADTRTLGSEFRMYVLVFAGISTLGALSSGSVLDSIFISASLVSSTGYATVGIESFSAFMQLLFLGVLFVGGSVGSTAGGLKIFRVRVLLELLRSRVRSFSLPDSALNKPVVDGKIVESSTLRTVAALLFSWLAVCFGIAAVVLSQEPVSIQQALSLAVSSVGNMGPSLASSEAVLSLSPVSRFFLAVGMIAGRLEMIPVLAIFNRKLLE